MIAKFLVLVHVTCWNEVVDFDGKWFVTEPCREPVRWVVKMALVASLTYRSHYQKMLILPKKQQSTYFITAGLKRTVPNQFAPYGLWGSNAPWFMCWFWCCINCLFVCLLDFLLRFLPFLLSSFFMLSLLFIYFLLTCLLPDLSTYSFQNKPLSVSRLEVAGGDQTGH